MKGGGGLGAGTEVSGPSPRHHAPLQAIASAVNSRASCGESVGRENDNRAAFLWLFSGIRWLGRQSLVVLEIGVAKSTHLGCEL